MERKTDLRVIKTKKALVDSLMQSLSKKSFEDITVQYLCDNALVRRATFYTHFADKYELLGYAFSCKYREFPSMQQSNDTMTPKEIYYNMVQDSIDFLSENTIALRSVMSSQTKHIILNVIRNELEKAMLPDIEKRIKHSDIDDLTPNLAFNFYLHGIFGSFMWWMREDYPITKDELITQVQCIFNGI